MYVAVLAGASGVLAASAGLRPAGSSPVDVVLVGLAAAAVTWAAATAPWWLVAMVALLAAGTAGPVALVAASMAAVVLACVVGAGRRNMPWARSLATLVAVQAFAHSGVHVFFGASALICSVALVILFVWGASRRPRPLRRTVGKVLACAGVGIAVAIVGLTIAGVVARAPLQEGNRKASEGLEALNRGDIAAASASFASAATAFQRADDALSAPWAQVSRVVPVVAQHRSSMTELTSTAADAMSSAASALAQVDPDSVRVVNGRIDLAAVRALEAPFLQLVQAIDDLAAGVGRSQSPWLAAPLQRRLASLGDDLVDNRVKAGNALLAVQVAPAMLGETSVRRYFVAFTTPAESRGLGGFMGNYAELTIDQGRIEMSDFGRHTDLNYAGDLATRRLSGLDEFVEHWGRFDFANHEGGTTGSAVWSNVTMAPDFPTVAQVISQLYPQSGGRPLDGVFMLDPQAVAALMSFTGPVAVDGVDQQLTADNATQFIVKDQYRVEAADQRIDLLDTIARATVDRLLSSTLPPPAKLAETFAPLVAQDRLMAWSAHADEEQLLSQVKMDGAFPVLEGRDGVAVTVDNGGNNKIDAYLETAVDYLVNTDGSDAGAGVRSSTITITLTNTAPSSGLPGYVIDNGFGLPLGTNRAWLSVYSALPMVAVQVDGRPDGMETGQVFGWNVSSRYVDIPPGRTVTVTMMVEGTLQRPDAGAPVIRVQPLFTPAVYTMPSAAGGE